MAKYIHSGWMDIVEEEEDEEDSTGKVGVMEWGAETVLLCATSELIDVWDGIPTANYSLTQTEQRRLFPGTGNTLLEGLIFMYSRTR